MKTETKDELMRDYADSIHETEAANAADYETISGEILELPAAEEITEVKSRQSNTAAQTIEVPIHDSQLTIDDSKVRNPPSSVRYIFSPLIFLLVALLGGWRLGAETSDFLFVRPALVCLIFAAVLLVLFFRTQLVKFDGWFSEDFTTLKNAANAAVLIALFAASVQIFNSLLPERGLPFWVVGFCFFWTLWNNLFAEFDTKKLLKSLGAMFALAFVVKYLVLANLTAPAQASWLESLLKNPTQSALTYLLDLPQYSAGTGYIQFFALVFYLIGLFLLPSSTDRSVKYEI